VFQLNDKRSVTERKEKKQKWNPQIFSNRANERPLTTNPNWQKERVLHH